MYLRDTNAGAFVSQLDPQRVGKGSQRMMKHLCSAVSYGGACTLDEMRRTFWADPGRFLIKLSESARSESFDR